MEQTSRLSIVIDMGNAESNLARLRQLLHDTNTAGNSLSSTLSAMGRNNPFAGFANSMSATTNSMQRLNNATNSMNGGLGRLNGQMNAINRTSGQARSSIQSLAGSVAHLNGRFYDANGRLHEANGRFVSVGNSMAGVGRGANTLSGAFGGLQRQIQGLQSSFANLQSLFMGGFFASIALGVGRTADTMQNLHSQIKLVTSSSEEYQVIQERLHEMANKNLTNVQSTIGLYTNSARSLGQMGKSQEEVLKFTHAISLAMNVGGKSAQEQAAALLQLGQAMQSGVVQGDEFRSLAENAPILLDLVAESLGKTRGEVRELSKEGKITAEVMYNAVANATPKLQAMFDKMPVTMAQGFTVLTNEYKKFTHEMMNGEGGISSTIAKGLIGISKHFETLAKVAIAGAGVAVVGYTNRLLVMTQAKIASTVATTGLSGAVTRLGLVLKAHPLMAMATVIIGTSVATRGLDETLNDLGNTLSVIGSVIGDVINLFADLGSSAYTIFQDIVSSADNTTKTSSQLFGGFFNDVGSGFQGMLVGTGKVFDAMATTVKTFGQFAGENIAYFVNNAGNLFKILANKTADVFENIVNGVIGTSVNFIIGKINTVIETGNKAAELFGSDPLPLLDPYKSQFKIGNRYQVTGMVQTRTWGELFDENAKFQTENGAAQYVQGKYSGLNTEFKSDLNNPMGKAQQTKPKDDKDKDKKDGGKKDKDGDFSKRPLEVSIYKAFIDEGATHSQALALTAEVGRENDFNADLIFGTHTDPARDKRGRAIRNYGMLSWNQGREKPLMQSLQQAGLIKNGKMVRSQEALRLQARHALREALETNRQKHLSHFWGNPNADPESFAAGLGKGLIGWAYGQDTIRGRNGGRVAFDWRSHDNRRRRHLERVKQMVNGGYAGSRTAKDDIKDEQERHKAQQDFYAELMTANEKLDNDFKNKYAEISTIFANNVNERDRLHKILENNYTLQKAYNQKLFDFQNNSENMNIWERLDKLYELEQLNIDLDNTLDDKQKEQKKQAHAQKHLRKTDEVYLGQLSQELEINGWRMSAKTRLGIEKDLAVGNLRLNTELAEDQKKLWEQSITQHYDFKIQKHDESQKKIIDDFNKLIKDGVQDGHFASLTDRVFKDKMSKFGYEKWKLDNLTKQQELNEEKRYQDLRDSIEAKNDTGQYVIEDAAQRHLLLQEAEKAHQQEMQAIRETYALDYKELERSNFEYRLGLYQRGLDMFSSVWNSATDIVKNAFGEQSGAAKVMFYAQKGIAIAQAIINTEMAATKALAEGGYIAGVPMASIVRAMGYASVGLMTAQTLSGFATGGYTGNIGTSQVAGVVHGQEYVLNAKATKRIGTSTLDRLNSGGDIGSNSNHINVYVTVNSDGSNVQADTKMGKTMGEAMAKIAYQTMVQETRQNGFLDRLYRR